MKTAYPLPSNAREFDRLDLQHWALREARGTNYSAPVKMPKTILDCGSGSGRWAHDLSEQFPASTVVGIDLQPGRPGPKNFRFVRANLLDHLPFRDGSFNFVHQRFLLAGIPVRRWQDCLREIARVTAPGGYIELTECANRPFKPEGSATGRLLDLTGTLLRKQGLDSTDVVHRHLESWLRLAGCGRTGVQVAALPLGNWGGEIGGYVACDVRTALIGLSVALDVANVAPLSATRALISAAVEEWEVLHPHFYVTTIWGQR